MKNVYVVTHPEATHHVDGLVGGWFDSNLTDRGAAHAQAMADSLAERLGNATVEVHSSDLLRARRTADVIAKRLDANMTIDTDLREKSYGAAGGRPQAWLNERFIPPPEVGERMRHDEGVEGAESRMDLAVRAYAAMERIQEMAVESQVVVTHGGTATYLLAAWIGMPIDAADRVHFRFTSGGISLLRKEDVFHSHQIVQLNETGHLR
ncbi:putative phosphoglycerate mutase [Haloactinopolyspora alba]|uniref:Putative phosphoglycerate mutase n=1 Tax=Haloactinopolyspora alba TaxID=648780 RepID=A0A2P8DHF4_9ACTN|nr:histidine phosphatase family protein [Haloactinopolyspora alba]PSK96657.1 putative phosphoglycerate mutase [Haloactinopolyspora alba]